MDTWVFDHFRNLQVTLAHYSALQHAIDLKVMILVVLGPIIGSLY